MRHPANRTIAISLLALAWLLVLSAGAFAGEKAGTVTNLSGPLFAKKADGTTMVLYRNSIVEEGDTWRRVVLSENQPQNANTQKNELHIYCIVRQEISNEDGR